MKSTAYNNNQIHNQNSNIKQQNIKKIYNIQSTTQIKSYLLNENINSLKTIILFILSAIKQFPKNISLFYEILLQLIDKINVSVDYQNIKWDPSDKSLITNLFEDYSNEIEIINKNFDNIFSDELINYYLISISKHNITIFIFCLMTAFTYISFDIEKSKNSKKEIYHLLQKIRNKYICRDLNRILCPGCSLNCITKVIVYINRFISNKSSSQDNINNLGYTKEEEVKNQEEIISTLNMLNSKVIIIKNGIDFIEQLIQEEKINREKVIKEMNALINQYQK